ncbi:Fic family protein [Agreia pratensis]|uniref:Fic/DOC family protein n=1 Tax=Agreia pratensis TaxID=150121 RepID=UPI00188AF68D|nr:Fic family protein [Agreia pratensis]MBF4636205.1 Fic family protein [Agreia pratensis]
MPSRFSSWDSYFWEPGGSVLRNLYGERDSLALEKKEYAETNAQQFDIERGAVEISRTYDADHLEAIHKQLFGNVYEWAGEFRTTTLTNFPTDFAGPKEIPKYLSEASKMIGAADWSTMDRDQFAAAAAKVFAHVNQAHPFREGNGRTSKLFMQHVSELSPYRINYDPRTSGVTKEVWNQASMFAGPDLGKSMPQPESLVPVFRAMAVERGAAALSEAKDKSPELRRDRSSGRASFPTAPSTARNASAEAGYVARVKPTTPDRRYDVGRD